MPTMVLAVFIGGLIFMAAMGLVCGYYTLKLVLLIEKKEAEGAGQARKPASPAAEEKQKL